MGIAPVRDEQTFDQIYANYNALISAYVQQQVGSPEEAADLVQDIFLKVYLGLASLDRERRISPWLYSIATHTVIDEFRRRKRSIPSSYLPTLDADLVDLQSADILEAVHTRDLLYATFRQLPQSTQVLLRLRFQEDLPLVQIARVLNLSERAAKARLSRAQKLFRASYRALERGGNSGQRRGGRC